MTFDQWMKKLCGEAPNLRATLEGVKKTAKPLPLEMRFMVIN